MVSQMLAKNPQFSASHKYRRREEGWAHNPHSLIGKQDPSSGALEVERQPHILHSCIAGDITWRHRGDSNLSLPLFFPSRTDRLAAPTFPYSLVWWPRTFPQGCFHHRMYYWTSTEAKTPRHNPDKEFPHHVPTRPILQKSCQSWGREGMLPGSQWRRNSHCHEYQWRRNETDGETAVEPNEWTKTRRWDRRPYFFLVDQSSRSNSRWASSQSDTPKLEATRPLRLHRRCPQF